MTIFHQWWEHYDRYMPSSLCGSREGATPFLVHLLPRLYYICKLPNLRKELYLWSVGGMYVALELSPNGGLQGWSGESPRLTSTTLVPNLLCPWSKNPHNNIHLEISLDHVWNKDTQGMKHQTSNYIVGSHQNCCHVCLRCHQIYWLKGGSKNWGRWDPFVRQPLFFPHRFLGTRFTKTQKFYSCLRKG